MKKNEISKQVNNLSDDECRDMLEDCIRGDYTLVLWPDCQIYMEKWWFRKEAYLCQAFDNQKHYDSAYFIPTFRLM